LVNLDEIGGYSAISKLKSYEGKNPYIKKMKKKLLADGKITLTPIQSKYIMDNFDSEPILINKIVNITEFLGESLQQNEKLSFKPERILIEYMLADSEKTYHVYGKLTKKQEKSGMYFLPKTQVVDDPYFVETNIEVDFEKYEKLDQFVNSEGKVGRKILEHQKSGIKFLLTRNGAILADDMGLGKGVVINTLAITPKGMVKFGDLKVGDKIIGSNGKPCNIMGVYPQGVKDIYKITFNDGYSITTDNSHLWTVSSCNSGENSKNRENRYTTLSVEQMLDENLILEQIGTGLNKKRPYKFKTYYKRKNGSSKWQIPIVKPIQFDNDDTLPIEPYLLGLSLGDGHFTKSSAIVIELHENDFDELLQGITLTEHKTNENKKRAYINYHSSDIKELKLENTRSDNKFIPEIYKYSKIENRLAILQGLMDTDGHCMKSKKGEFNGTEYCTVSEKLADDIAEIVHSLGGIVKKKSKIGSYKNKDGTVVKCKKVYRLNIKMPEEFNPFRLKRKADEYNQPKKYKVGRYIKSIEPCGQGETVCISVDAPDKLYVTEHAIVTHNTVQSIVAAIESGAKKILIVCPSSAKINWQREINYLQEEDTTIISGSRWSHAKFTIINFDILKNFHTLKDDKNDGMPPIRDLVNANFDLCIIDEAHNLRNHKSIRGAIMTELCVDYGIERVWLLSGTPVANRPMDFYNLLRLIKSPLVDNWKFYAQRYCEGKQITTTLKNRTKRKIWITSGASNLDELSIKTRNLLLRRMKDEVLDMPDKIRVPNYFKMSNKQQIEYDSLWEDYLIERKKQKKKGAIQRDLVELGLLRKYIAMETIPETIALVDEVIEQGHKVIIFTCFTDELRALSEHYGNNCVIHYGEINEKEKQKSVDKFQMEGGPMVFIGNIISAGTAITLTRSTYVVFNSFDWVPGNSEQAEDRSYRLGQKNNVTVYYNLFENTIVSTMWHTLNRKKNIINQIMSRNDNNTTAVDEIVDYIIEDKKE
jgi:hypothetical protein